MPRRPKISTQLIEQAMGTPAVRRALRAKANRILPRSQRLAATAGAQEFAKALDVEEGTRPGAKASGGLRRPFARVVAELTDEQAERDTGAKLTRRQILRRSKRA